MIRPSFSPSLCGLAWGLMLVAGSVAQAAEPEAAGVVRISKPAAGHVQQVSQVQTVSDAATVTIRGQSTEITPVGCKECEAGVYDGYSHGGHASHGGHFRSKDHYYGDGDCEACKGGKFGHRGEWCDVCGKYHGGSGKGGAAFEYFKCKFGYFFPTGCGGAGCPPIGRYARVYPQDPGYFDQRDGQLYGAAGYGTPIAVPLAPVVSHQYNYSWGVPSSRLTPVSRIAPY